MQELSKLSADERLFHLSDHKSRTILADNLSREKVLHVPAPEKKLVKESPAAEMQAFH